MGARVLLGDNGDEYGLYVSQYNDDVTNPTKPLAFDSRAVGSLPVHAYGQGILSAPSTTQANPYATTAFGNLYATPLSYTPLFAVRWCYPSDISSGKAGRVYNNAYFQSDEPQFSVNPQTEQESEWTTYKQQGVDVSSIDGTGITIRNYHSGKTVVVVTDQLGIAPSPETGTGKTSIYYSWIVFKVEDFTGGHGL